MTTHRILRTGQGCVRQGWRLGFGMLPRREMRGDVWAQSSAFMPSLSSTFGSTPTQRARRRQPSSVSDSTATASMLRARRNRYGGRT